MTSIPRPEAAAPGGTLFVCHAGASLGIGHLTRMLTVAHALNRMGRTSSRFLIQGDRIERDDLTRFDHSFIDLETDLAETVAEMCDELSPATVVFDLHPKLIPTDFSALSAELRAGGVHTVGVDSLLPLCESLDVTWVPSLLVDDAQIAPCEGAVHWGWDSFLLAERAPVDEWVPGVRVLVLTGGSDVTDQRLTLPSLLDARLPDGSHVWWVRGPFAGDPVLPAKPRLEWVIHEAPSGLDELIVECDYAVTVFGVTLFELLQYGIPTVVFSPYDYREFPELDAVSAAGVAMVADGADTAVVELAALMDDHDRARTYSQTALDRMAGNGADRLAGLIHSFDK